MSYLEDSKRDSIKAMMNSGLGETWSRQIILGLQKETKENKRTKMNETPTVKLTGVFPKTFRATKCETGRADCRFEYTDEKKQVMFQVSLHGAVELREHFLELGYTELAPKMK